MRARWTLAVVAVVLLAALVWLLGADPADDAGDGAPDAAPEGDHAAELAARGARDAASPTATEAPEPTRRWTLVVVYTRVARDVPFLELRAAPDAEGEPLGVTDVLLDPEDGLPTDSPFAGTEVDVLLGRGAASTRLATTTLDEYGHAKIDVSRIDTLDPMLRGASHLEVRPRGEGVHLMPEPRYVGNRPYPYGVRVLRLPARVPEGDVRMLLVVPAHGGGVVTGRAVLPTGKPVAHGRVIVSGTTWHAATDACTDDEGRFAFTVHEAGSFDIEVRARNGARLRRKDVALPAGRDVELPLFRLGGTGRFAGRILYPDGTPAEGVRVQTSSGRLRPGSSVRIDPLPCQTDFYDAETRTDADGRFQVFTATYEGAEGATSGSVSASVPGVGRVEQHDAFAWLAGGPSDDLRATVRGHKLAIRTRTPEGDLLPGVQVKFWSPDETKRPVDRMKARAGIVTDASGQGALWMPPGSRWRVTARLEGATPLVTEHVVPEKGNASDLDLTLEPLTEPVPLAMELHDPEGQALWPTVFTVTTPEGIQLFSRRVDRPGFTLPVAGGRAYIVDAWSIEDPGWSKAPDADGRYGYSFTQRWMPAATRIDVKAGAPTARVVLETTEAAHLEVVLTRAAGLEGRELPWSMNVALEHEATGRTLSPSAPTRPWSEERPTSRKVLDEELEPGSWLVRFSARGLKTVTRKIELEAGRVGTVEFILEKE